jgi:hypothetical protein
MIGTLHSPRASTPSSRARTSKSSAPRSRRKAHAVAERWIRSVRAEGLDRLLIVSKLQLRQVLREYVAYDNQRRAHQGLGQRCTVPSAPASVDSIVARRHILGDLVHAYDRAVAYNASFC